MSNFYLLLFGQSRAVIELIKSNYFKLFQLIIALSRLCIDNSGGFLDGSKCSIAVQVALHGIERIKSFGFVFFTYDNLLCI